jgi:nucleoside-diphosphate-sugar epimerase
MEVSVHGAWDYVIHNAGVTKTLRKSDFERINTQYTSNLVDALANAGCSPKKFLLMSSLSVFGPGEPTCAKPITPDDMPKPDTVYGRSKLKAEQAVIKNAHFPYVILRPTGVYGPGDKDYLLEMQSVRQGFDMAAGKLPQHLSFIYVKDLAKAALTVLEAGSATDEKQYFVSDGNTYTDVEFAMLIKEIIGKKRLIRMRIPLPLVYLACLCSTLVGKIMRKTMTLNTDKYRMLKGRNWTCKDDGLYNDVGFLPEYDLEKGLKETIAWYIDAGWLNPLHLPTKEAE